MSEIPVSPESLARMRKVLLIAEQTGWNAAVSACREKLPLEWSIELKDLYQQTVDVGIVKISHVDGPACWRERAVKAESALDKIIHNDTKVSDGGKVHDHGPCAEIAIEALKR